jgi:hypothetical protein
MPSDALTRRFSHEVISSAYSAWMVRRERRNTALITRKAAVVHRTHVKRRTSI